MITPPPAVLTHRHMEALLEFLQGAGVDAFLDLDPVDRFAQSEQDARRAPMPPAGPRAPMGQTGHQFGHQTAPQVAALSGRGTGQGTPPPLNLPSLTASPAAPMAPASAPGPGQAVIPGEEAVRSAREAARSAATLEELKACLAAFRGCNLQLTAKSLVFSDGNPAARLMFVGEAPGSEEDATGVPFVGRSGKLLDRMLGAIGLDRTSVYIANVVPWRPPGNRTPTPQETEICRPFIARQIELVDPDVLVFLGAASAKALTGATDGIRKMRGRWMQYDTGRRKIRALATYHPAYLLRSPLEKRLAWRDFLTLRQVVAGDNHPVE
ncbi:uracil-DNA glycosylase [Pannonibacter tanglangensis]|uniref:Type-4 uracil-DNA glycosylase n=1 Tax=Pannonibacter tanglangensis TaxID=2750084 RepID=A0ABW9ZHX1_9HYPH|nr:uracil-DNA glycosylase [Pannonibacter sp. XCT-34]NBN64376.1 uracil-DNA glycosylase [Pannonibacter sp. XCT-34]